MLGSKAAFTQKVPGKFEKLVISENFDSAGTVWQTMAASQNLFLVQGGEYILQRKSDQSPFAVIANFERDFSEFRLLTSLSLEKAYGSEASVGLLIMAQTGGDGGFVLEFNKDYQFRLRQISGGMYIYLTGSSKDGGWKKFPFDADPGSYLQVEVTRADNAYDLYVNKRHLLSFNDPGYETGQLGFIIGPSSRGKVDYFYIFERSVDTGDVIAGSGAGSDPTVVELAESIIVLRGQVNELTEENEALKRTIAAMKSGEDEKQVSIKNYEKQISFLNEEMLTKDNRIDSLSKANRELQKYKEVVGDERSGDIVISLSKNLKSERERREQLEKENAELRKLMGLPKTGKIPDPENGDGKNDGSFALPKK
jgi:ssRNA-specific RNase YbeY (16S rRNA maturation enzyme)